MLGSVRKLLSMGALLAGLVILQPAAAPAVLSPVLESTQQLRPNVVLMFPDNLGVGEVGSYGGARGVPTPNIDRIAAEGMRLTNFNVEYSCVVSRIALLTGRYSVRTGEGYRGGMTLWEVTIAEALRSVGYATALFGKWHVGGDDWEGRREPTHQGFDRWWGIPGTSNAAQFTSFDGFDPDPDEIPYIWEGQEGEPSRRTSRSISRPGARSTGKRQNGESRSWRKTPRRRGHSSFSIR